MTESTDSPLDDLDEILTAYGGKLERVAQHALQGVVYDEPNPNGKTLKQAIELYCHKQVIEARQDQIMMDELAYTANLDVDESQTIKIRDILLAALTKEEHD
jgi:hypothetical protein